jgi:hypothetical protein
MLCHVDMSFLDENASAFSAVGYLPDWFYRLQRSADLRPVVTIAGLDLNEFHTPYATLAPARTSQGAERASRRPAGGGMEKGSTRSSGTRTRSP